MARETKHATLIWQQGLRFTASDSGGPGITVDGDNVMGPGPMLTLLLAAAACSGSDVVLILEKMRVKLHELRIEIAGTRREEEPRRYVAIHLDYHLGGEGIDEVKARRAIDLSLEKYCSVIHSLAPDIAVTYALSLG
ncbi:MAG TPA: OsmC family protein [Gemmatimonadales bacterium]|jgi:putative redox protein|nr:OsmC family protein [Gemmatimonadales bacterium]